MRWELDHVGYKMCENYEMMHWIKAVIGVLVIALLIAVLVRVLRGGKGCPLMGRMCGMASGGAGRRASALTMLEERYAKGEINTDEFTERKKELEK